MKHFACLSAGVTYVANGEPPIGIPWETFQKKKTFAKFTPPLMKKGVIIMSKYYAYVTKDMSCYFENELAKHGGYYCKP